MVIEAVSVLDKNGKPIEGLSSSDFVVTENNVPQTVKICEFQKLDMTPEPPAPEPVPTLAANARIEGRPRLSRKPRSLPSRPGPCVTTTAV